jgi:hypothetical protein
VRELNAQSVAGVVEVQRLGSSSGPAEFLIEIPHGATRRADFDRVRERLCGPFPDRLEDFFHVNTDIGTPECGAEVARRLSRRGASVLLLRSLIPRTFVDCNRRIDISARKGGMTPGLPEYVRHPQDLELLCGLYADYHRQAAAAYDEVCGTGGLALMLHSYAPKSVEIEQIDDGIVAALRNAYLPQNYERWRARPAVEAITQDGSGRELAPADVLAGMVEAFAAIEITLETNQTYRLHEESMGFVYSDQFLGQVTCVELNRGLLADPFDPFVEMKIAPAAAQRFAEPMAMALHGARDRSSAAD